MSKKKKVLMMVLAALIGLLLLACAAFYVVFDVPNWQKLDASKLSALAQTSSMYDAQGELMSELRGAENRNIVSLDEIPMHTRQAFLAEGICAFTSIEGLTSIESWVRFAATSKTAHWPKAQAPSRSNWRN